MGTFILLLVILGTVLLGRYALIEAQRIEDQKRFRENLDKHSKKRKTK